MLRTLLILAVTLLGPPIKESTATMIYTITGTDSAPQELTVKQSGSTFYSPSGTAGVRMPSLGTDTELSYHFVCAGGALVLFPFGGATFKIGDTGSDDDYNNGYLMLDGPGRVSVYGGNGVWIVKTYGDVVATGSSYSVSRTTGYRGGEADSQIKTLVAPAKALSTAGATSAATPNATGLSFANGANNDQYLQFILPSDWEEGTNAKLFLHYMKSTSASGTVKWQARWRVANYIGTYVLGSWSSFVDFDTTINGDGDTVDRQAIVSFPAIDLSRAGGSPVYARMIDIQFRRLSSGGSADTYAAPVTLVAAALHYNSDTKGWRTSFTK